MALYWSLNSVPELSELTPLERSQTFQWAIRSVRLGLSQSVLIMSYLLFIVLLIVLCTRVFGYDEPVACMFFSVPLGCLFAWFMLIHIARPKMKELVPRIISLRNQPWQH